MAEEKKAAEGEKKKSSKLSSAKKRHLQSEKKRLFNRAFEAKVKTAIRSFETALSSGDKTVCMTRLNSIFSLMDKGVKTGHFKLNKAARTKSRLSKRVSV